MAIADIEAHLNDLKDQALAALDVDEQTREQIKLADTPNPEQGDRGFPVFALARTLRKAPPLIAQDVKEQLDKILEEDTYGVVSEIVLVGPYVNFKLDDAKVAKITVEQVLQEQENFGSNFVQDANHWMIEFSAPNTNKPQHLGHVRNNLLGESVARILAFAGHKVTRVNLINDRGIHICKSMLAYQKFGDGETPESTGTKGDHLVGKYYVVFNTKFEQEYAKWQDTDEATAKFEAWLNDDKQTKRAKSALGKDASREDMQGYFFKSYKDTYFNNESTLGAQTKQMLLDWEDGNEEVHALWKKMNQWVFDGFDETYKRLGVHFDQVYYESDTYLLGKDLVSRGLEQGIFREVEGGAIACDLEQIGMKGDKILLRSDGTSVYMTQDLGTALKRFDEHGMDGMIYVVGDEQRHHFKVLFGILGLLREELEGKLHHLSYGMVELPDGKMKSREGTVVDADDLMEGMRQLMIEEGKKRNAENAEAGYPTLPEEVITERAEPIGLGALKYFILDFNPTTTVHFDPDKAIDPSGRTGVLAMYAYARIHGLKRELGSWPALDEAGVAAALEALGSPQEMAVVKALRAWPHTLEVAVRDHDPSKVAEYLFNLCSAYNTLYNHKEHKIKDLEGPRRDGVFLLSKAVSHAAAAGMNLLGIAQLEEL